jgi:transposase
MAKSVHDTGWAILRNMLSYKSIATGGVVRVASERGNSQGCSCWASIPGSGLKGMGAWNKTLDFL